MVTVAIYIYINGVAKRIELFNDEKISVTSSVQDTADLSKVFTDYSQSFTVPATKQNNAIFGHWYENSIDNAFDARIRKDAYIELDTIRFRKGKIQLEKASLKNGQPENYSITFFGSLISLKDAFNGKQLKQLDFTAYNIEYNLERVADAIGTTVTGHVKFPLISSGNVWQYGTGGNVPTNWDITNVATPAYINELYPAMRVSEIFKVIATSLGVTFSGAILNDDRFKRLFLYLKNADALFKYVPAPTKINFGSKTASPTIIGDNFNLTTDSFTYDGGKLITPNGVQTTSTVSGFLEISFTTAGSPYQFIFYKDGVKISTLNLVSTLLPFVIEVPLDSVGVYTFSVGSNTALSYNATFNYQVDGLDPVTGLPVTNTLSAQTTTTQTTLASLDISAYMPEITVEDFIAGILKMFNLTCYSDTSGVFKIEQLEAWYANGATIDISKYVVSDTTDIDRQTTYKNINFKYEKSESNLAVLYRANSLQEYGDLEFQLAIDGGNYDVKLPFENLPLNKFSGTQFQVGYSLKSDLKPYKPKPIVLYDYGTLLPCNFYLGNGTTNNYLGFYNAFGQDALISGSNYTINWGTEQSSLTGQVETKTLFNQYYETYINNIFNYKARKIKIKAVLPISLLTSIKLNDCLIVRDKKYLINSFTTDLTTGVVDFDLLTNFR